MMGRKPVTTTGQVDAPKLPTRSHNLWKGCSVILSHESSMSISTQVGE